MSLIGNVLGSAVESVEIRSAVLPPITLTRPLGSGGGVGGGSVPGGTPGAGGGRFDLLAVLRPAVEVRLAGLAPVTVAPRGEPPPTGPVVFLFVLALTVGAIFAVGYAAGGGLPRR